MRADAARRWLASHVGSSDAERALAARLLAATLAADSGASTLRALLVVPLLATRARSLGAAAAGALSAAAAAALRARTLGAALADGSTRLSFRGFGALTQMCGAQMRR